MGFFNKIAEGLKKTRDSMMGKVDALLNSFTKIDEDFFDELEESLIMADVGAVTSARICENLRKKVKEEGLSDPAAVKGALKEIIAQMLAGDEALNLSTKPSIILVIGVNGVGKTTTIGKLAHNLHEDGKKVLLAAADTFRAAAIDQLQIWADRAGVDLVKHGEGSDPAAVVFDTIHAGMARGADLIICDDVEVPRNCDTALKRMDLREKLEELDYILTPQGMQLYIGTPHTFYTIYQVAADKSKPEIEPFLLNFKKLEVPILTRRNRSAWPERFSLEKIASLRLRSGENKFLSQMMLQPVNFRDSVLNPERLVAYREDLAFSFANGREILRLGDKRLLSASCWWDPSFAAASGDNSVIACVFTDETGHFWLHDLEYIRIEETAADDNIASLQCEKVADFIERNHLPSIRVEANGIGKFLPGILKQTLARRRIKAAVLEVYSSSDKSVRILEAFEVLLAEKALNVHRKIWSTPFIEEMREWTVEGGVHDDALDAVAGCLASEPVRFGTYPAETGDFKRFSWQGASGQFKAQTNFNL